MRLIAIGRIGMYAAPSHQCPLSGVNRTSLPHRKMSAYDPKRTKAPRFPLVYAIVTVGRPQPMQTSKPKKLTAASLDEFPLVIAATPASKQERRIALAIILVLTLVFIVIAPFASVRLPRVDAFVPALQTVLCITDLITAALLFSLYSIQPLPGLLALASGYIFSGLFAFLQTLAFPGAYAPSGLIGDPLSSAPYLFFRHRVCVVG